MAAAIQTAPHWHWLATSAECAAACQNVELAQAVNKLVTGPILTILNEKNLTTYLPATG